MSDSNIFENIVLTRLLCLWLNIFYIGNIIKKDYLKNVKILNIVFINFYITIKSLTSLLSVIF